MSKNQKLGFSTKQRFSKMHCLEYCYCLITIIIISVLIITIIIYHHYYHHYSDYYYHHHCYYQNRYPHLEYRYLKYYLEYNSGNKLVFIHTFRKLFINLTQKWCQPPKTEIKSKYEAGPSCTQVNKTEIKKISCGYYRYITICYLNQQSHREKFE